MAANLKFPFIIAAVILILGISVLQWGRMNSLHVVFPTNETEAEEFQVMSSAEAAENDLTIYLQEPEAGDTLGQDTLENVKYTLDYAQLDYELIQPEEVAGIPPSPWHILVLSGELIETWDHDAVDSFVLEGGRVLAANRFPSVEWMDVMGVHDFNDYIDDQKGITFEQDIFPGYPDLPPESTMLTHSILDLEIEPGAELIASVEGHPLLWEYEYGLGKVVYWNTTVTSEKTSRGLLLNSLSLLPPAMWINQSGMQIFHIDDFPAPIPLGSLPEGVDDSYRMSVKEFYTSVWWEDMKKLKDTYELPMTGYYIATYEDQFRMQAEDIIEDDDYFMLLFGRSLMDEGGEIGLHGYNHQSLVTEDEPIDPELGYVPWRSMDAMVDSLEEADELFDYFFPEHQMRSYVPPSNILNETGIEAIAEGLPDVNVISSIYDGEEKGSLIQEFGTDDRFEQLYHFPRLTSGYFGNTEEVFRLVDGIAHTGMMAHFIHPDDVLDPDRAKDRSWQEMHDSLEARLEMVNNTYPHLKGYTQQDALNKWKLYEQSAIYASPGENGVQLSGTEAVMPSTGYLRINEGPGASEGSLTNAFVNEVPGTAGLYHITVSAPDVTIPYEEEGSQ
ncbi:DUF2194 domain-containing protein [Alkalicoccus urumqiensis]|uniref:DUF2194 domain-containing protein n=1 Tax=Alkalicoccus urumqiensis TaxID=1548213 RepID=A0A2P6MLA6_ALKUR|nr:DUF2194 domain-containing protein [Alkalicoccus urumqiensis]PRO67062.1 DUF2194 domain-containing protein [Alkalicoccus urumqiensis]